GGVAGVLHRGGGLCGRAVGALEIGCCHGEQRWREYRDDACRCQDGPEPEHCRLLGARCAVSQATAHISRISVPYRSWPGWVSCCRWLCRVGDVEGSEDPRRLAQVRG